MQTRAYPDGPTVKMMQDVAKQYGMVLIVPLYEEEMSGIYYNSAAVIDAVARAGQARDQPDPLHSRAGSRAGVMSSLIGIAARHSIETGAKVRISELLDLPVRWKW